MFYFVFALSYTELGLVWMGANDMLLQPDSEHMFSQQTDSTYYNDTSQALQSLEDMRPQLVSNLFLASACLLIMLQPSTF